MWLGGLLLCTVFVSLSVLLMHTVFMSLGGLLMCTLGRPVSAVVTRLFVIRFCLFVGFVLLGKTVPMLAFS